MPVSQDILLVIPMGEENAVTARLLWKQLDLWSFASIKHKLNEMAVGRPDPTETRDASSWTDEPVLRAAGRAEARLK
jgi:hypothetical protein